MKINAPNHVPMHLIQGWGIREAMQGHRTVQRLATIWEETWGKIQLACEKTATPSATLKNIKGTGGFSMCLGHSLVGPSDISVSG